MVRGLYTAGWGMLAKQQNMDVVSNNLANVNTTGFKKDTAVFGAFPDVLASRINDTMSPSNPSGKVGKMQLSNEVGEVFTYYNQGLLQKTGNNLDFGIQGADNAFFTISVPGANGESKESYTRDGSFSLDSNGFLVTKEGNQVVGQKGPIKLSSESFSISDDGSILVNNKVEDKLMMKQFESTKGLKKVGNNLVEASAEEPATNFTGSVKQGYIEMSNVNTVKEMVDMISILRSYESAQKVIQAIDGTLEKAVNEVGSLR